MIRKDKRKKLRNDRSTLYHFIMLIGFGIIPFYLGGFMVKLFWDSVPVINKLQWLDLLTWQFGFVLLFYVIGFPLVFFMGAVSKCHADVIISRIKKVYLGED